MVFCCNSDRGLCGGYWGAGDITHHFLHRLWRRRRPSTDRKPVWGRLHCHPTKVRSSVELCNLNLYLIIFQWIKHTSKGVNLDWFIAYRILYTCIRNLELMQWHMVVLPEALLSRKCSYCVIIKLCYSQKNCLNSQLTLNPHLLKWINVHFKQFLHWCTCISYFDTRLSGVSTRWQY